MRKIIELDSDGNVINNLKVKGTLSKGLIPSIPFSLSEKDAKKIGQKEIVLDINVDYKKSSRRYTLVGEGTELPSMKVEEKPSKINITYDPDGGNANAYTLYGYRWNQKDPQLKWVLRNDANMIKEGLNAVDVQNAIMGASKTWDDASGQNLFADANLVGLNPNVITENYNKINTVSWRPFGSTCLGYARTYYKLDNIGGYHSVLDSDIVFNSDYNWRTDGSWNGVDVQTAALHEIGHTLGLGDIYGLPQFKYDTRQVMHYYTDVKRTLGNGDKTGITKLYG